MLTLICPRVVLVTNLFRDQLDRYGEVMQVRDFLARSFQNLAAKTSVVLNADDPLVATLPLPQRTKPVYFGLQSVLGQPAADEAAADISTCFRCNSPLRYSIRFFSHLGHYRCPNCDYKRPAPDVVATRIKLGSNQASYVLARHGETFQVNLPLGGMYNVYNALAASTVASALGVPLGATVGALETLPQVFGRTELLSMKGHQCCIILVKNPCGFNQAFS